MEVLDWFPPKQRLEYFKEFRNIIPLLQTEKLQIFEQRF